MKTIKYIFSTFLFLTFYLFATADGDTEKDTATNYSNLFYNEISQHLHYPEKAKSEGLEGFVVVSFTIANDGSIKIFEMNSNDILFYDSAMQVLSDIKLCSHATGKIFNMKFDYKLY
jgi:hypothetical protein